MIENRSIFNVRKFDFILKFNIILGSCDLFGIDMSGMFDIVRPDFLCMRVFILYYLSFLLSDFQFFFRFSKPQNARVLFFNNNIFLY